MAAVKRQIDRCTGKLSRIFLYGGLEKEQYRMISPDIDESNRKSLIILSCACAIVYLLRCCISYMRFTFTNRIIFVTAVILFAAIAVVNIIMKNHHRLVHISAYLFMFLYMGVGIAASVGDGSVEERTTLYLVFVNVAPMLFALSAVELMAVVLPTEAVYLLVIAKFQAEYPVYFTNQSNSVFFAITGLMLGIYMSNMKMSGIYNTYMNSRMQEIRELNDKLKKSREELQLALEAAEHANRSKTTFLNNMSHDIRTPMNAIIGFTSLAATHIDNKEQVQGYLKKIMTSSQHLLSLINDVLDMSRIESGNVKIDEKPLHLPDVLHDIRTIIQAGVSAKRLDLFIDTEDVVNENIVADKLRLNQILINLLSNAIKFTKTGGTIAIRVIQKPTAPEGYADYEFHVKDNGIGMSKEFQEHIFEAFTRENTTTVSGVQGTGLGMAITKNIVDMMGGTITLFSEEGVGTEFVVSLRFAISGENVRYENIPQLQGMRALVADDDTNTCLNMCRMLRKIGMRPDWTISGKEAVIRTEDALNEGDEFGAYIIDWLMPDMNGIETVRRIRKVIGNSKPIIILTAYDWADIEDEAREAGVTAFVSKPIFMSELREVLSRPFRVTPEPEEQTAGTQDFGGKSVLLVEDNELNQEIAREILKEKGFTVDVAGDGSEAVDKLRYSDDDRYDIILMDIQMPKMDGYEATRRIRTLSDRKKACIPIIAMTANAFEEDRREALEAGMDGFITKPFEADRLIEVLGEMLSKKDEFNLKI